MRVSVDINKNDKQPSKLIIIYLIFKNFISPHIWLFKVITDQFGFLGNYPPTPPLSQHFALSEKCQRWLRGGVGGHLRTGAITKWRNTGDWKDNEQYPHQSDETNNGFHNTKNHPPPRPSSKPRLNSSAPLLSPLFLQLLLMIICRLHKTKTFQATYTPLKPQSHKAGFVKTGS